MIDQYIARDSTMDASYLKQLLLEFDWPFQDELMESTVAWLVTQRLVRFGDLCEVGDFSEFNGQGELQAEVRVFLNHMLQPDMREKGKLKRTCFGQKSCA